MYFNVSSVNLKENKRSLEISHAHHIHVAYKRDLCRYRAVGVAIGSLNLHPRKQITSYHLTMTSID